MIQRQTYIRQILKDLKKSRVVALLGPRQCGKTTLALEVLKLKKLTHHFFDLEDPDHFNALQNPKLALSDLDGLIVIDEIQRIPNLFVTMRYLIDKHQKRFLILGSASQALLQQSAETLTGRIRYREITPLSLQEVKQTQKLWFRGGFPLAYLETSDEDAQNWLKDYVKTFIEKDVPNFGIDLNSQKIRKFWMMLTHYHGQIFNASEIARAIETSYKTAQFYLDILQNTLMIRTLQPWFENISKRQVKSPKIYFRDSGVFHLLMGLTNMKDVRLSPKIGASFEGFALEEIIRVHQADPFDCFFWSTHSGAELDLLLFPHTQRLGFEIKYTSLPKVTLSMRQVLHDLRLKKLYIIIPGDADYMLEQDFHVMGLEKYIAKNIIEN